MKEKEKERKNYCVSDRRAKSLADWLASYTYALCMTRDIFSERGESRQLCARLAL